MKISLDLSELLERQRGLASRARLLRHGITQEMLRWRLSRTWQAVHRGVVVTFTGQLDGHQRLIAAQLYAAPLAYLSRRTTFRTHINAGMTEMNCVAGQHTLFQPWRHRSPRKRGTEEARMPGSAIGCSAQVAGCSRSMGSEGASRRKELNVGSRAS